MDNWIWFHGGNCRKGSLEVDFLPQARFVYRAHEYMFSNDVSPCLRDMTRDAALFIDNQAVETTK